MKILNEDEEVKRILGEEDVQRFLKVLQSGQGVDLYEVIRKDPRLGEKLKFLISKGVLNVSSALPP